MDYNELLQRHQALLRDEASIAELLPQANGAELEALGRKMRLVAAECDSVFELMLMLLETKRLLLSDDDSV